MAYIYKRGPTQKIFWILSLMAYINGLWTLIPWIPKLTPPDPPRGQGHPFFVKIGQFGGVTKNGSTDHVMIIIFFLFWSSNNPNMRGISHIEIFLIRLFFDPGDPKNLIFTRVTRIKKKFFLRFRFQFSSSEQLIRSRTNSP